MLIFPFSLLKIGAKVSRNQRERLFLFGFQQSSEVNFIL